MDLRGALRGLLKDLLPRVPQVTNEPLQYEFLAVSDAAIDEFYRQAELALEGTVKLALAADSRATTSTSILSAASAGALVVSANLAGSDHPHTVLITAIVSASICLLLAAVYCALASRPIDFFVTGYEPKLLYPAAVDSAHIKRVSSADIQVRLDANRAALLCAAQTLRRGQLLAALAPLIFLITFCLFYR